MSRQNLIQWSSKISHLTHIFPTSYSYIVHILPITPSYLTNILLLSYPYLVYILPISYPSYKNFTHMFSIFILNTTHTLPITHPYLTYILLISYNILSSFYPYSWVLKKYCNFRIGCLSRTFIVSTCTIRLTRQRCSQIGRLVATGLLGHVLGSVQVPWDLESGPSRPESPATQAYSGLNREWLDPVQSHIPLTFNTFVFADILCNASLQYISTENIWFDCDLKFN